MKPITKKEQRIVHVFLKCKVAEEKLPKRSLNLGDCFDAFALGKEIHEKTGTLETIIRDILEHDRIHPTHGVGCACHDESARKLRALMHVHKLDAPENQKSRSNLVTVLSYIVRNP